MPVLAILAVVCFAGCEGEQGPVGPEGPAGATGPEGPEGPAGPELLLAYGDLDIIGSSYNALSLGPSGVSISAFTANTSGDYTITVDGSFPDTQGTMIVSMISEAGTNNTAIYGDIVSWSTSQIQFRVWIVAITTGDLVQDDFSFLIIGE